MIDYSSIYYRGGTLSLPRPPRVYFDSGAHEWNSIPTKQKLLDIGYLTTMGYDFYQDIQDILINHAYISEWEIKYSIAALMAWLSGRTDDVLADRYKGVPLKEMLEDLKDFVVNHYVLPHDGSDHYLIECNVNTTDYDILMANHWNIVADNCRDNEALFSENNEYIYPGDKPFIQRYNSTASEKTRFVVNAVPYPFQGNPLSAKVIILSLNPGYVPRVNDYFAKILQHCPQLADGVMSFLRKNLQIRVREFMPEVHGASDKHPNYQDAYNMFGDWYWYDILSKWTTEGLTKEDIFSNVALIQYIPYASEKAKDLPKGCVLPSQMFAKKLIRHIAETKDSIFVVPRAVIKWNVLLGSTWQKLEDEGRIIIGKNPLSQHLTANNLGEEPYRKIINHLK